MNPGVMFAKRVFLFAGVLGLLILVPQYFMEGRIARDFPPPITHPEHFYGFVGVGTVWQVLFLIISRDPVRLRPAMPAAVLEQIAFGFPAIVLYLQGRLPAMILGFGLFDRVSAYSSSSAISARPPQIPQRRARPERAPRVDERVS